MALIGGCPLLDCEEACHTYALARVSSMAEETLLSVYSLAACWYLGQI